MTLRRSLRIVISGMVAKVPHQGGATWAVLQYLLGFTRLGHDVCFIEPIEPGDLQPRGTTLAASRNARYFADVMREFGLEQNSVLFLSGTDQFVGRPLADARAFAQSSDVLVNISGTLRDPAFVDRIPVRVYLDLDPVFNQLWHATEQADMHFDGHTHFVTVGQSIGGADCSVPTCGREWIPTLQPIALEHWPVADGVQYDGLTTIANWRGYGSIQHDGVFYGQKAHALRPLVDLPARTGEPFMLALSIHPDEKKDLDALRGHGWRLLDPAEVADTPSSYRAFIGASKAEFGLAKAGYVTGRCGWFSDRSVCYLASGRPVVAQDTGFSRHLPTGAGLLRFTTSDEVIENVGALRRDYARHARAARALAEECFDSDKVLTHFLDRVGAQS
jgi:hypothetical protein